MGSVGAMARGSADRYFQQDIQDHLKLVPEGHRGPGALQGPGARHHPPAGRRREGGDGLYRVDDDRRAAEAREVRPHHQRRPVAKAMSTTSPSPARRPTIRRASHDSGRSPPGGDRDARRGRSLRRATTARPPTPSSPAISSSGAMPARRTAGRCASWCSAPSAGRPSGRRAGARRCSGSPTTTRRCAICSASRAAPNRSSAMSRAAPPASFPSGCGPSCRRSSARANGRRCSIGRRSTCG